MTTDLAVRPPEQEAVSGLEAAERIFTPERREAIARYIDISVDDPGFIPFLAMAAHYGLNPLTGEIWLIPVKSKGRDGAPDKEMLRPATGRDGYLKIARGDALYRGIHADVVRENDSFRVFRKIDTSTPDGDSLVIEHDYPDLAGPRQDGVGASEWRGKPIGAYAVAYAEGRKPFYYWAPLREHGKMGEGRNGAYWKGAWSYTSAMLVKAAVSHALRIAFGITGLVPADEIREGELPPAPEDAEKAAADALEGIGPELAGQIRDLITRLNKLEPGSYPAAKAEMELSGQSPERLEGIADRLEAEVHAAEVRAEEASAAWEASREPPEAEIVEEPSEPPTRPEGQAPDALAALRDQEAELITRLDSAEEGLEREALEAELRGVREAIEGHDG